MGTNLKEYTRGQLLASPLSDREVATVLSTSVTWVKMFREGTIKSPNVDTIQRLYEHLTGKPLLEV